MSSGRMAAAGGSRGRGLKAEEHPVQECRREQKGGGRQVEEGEARLTRSSCRFIALRPQQRSVLDPHNFILLASRLVFLRYGPFLPLLSRL